jgi:exonuclease SbcC
MKILRLRLQNLNSLYGQWSFDFTAPEFQENGIFAITGPTGAGKSTILDGICLALYGRTPRLERVNKSNNEIMSSRTGECFAEVVFASKEGTFCCHFSQHRARKKPDGALVNAHHEISDYQSGAILASKKRDVACLVEHYTGMDFDRFTRSVLLAQGDFAAFLQAPPDKRAPVLEQITGTKIYSDISRQVHERFRKEQHELEILKQQSLSIELLSDEEEKALTRTAREIDKNEEQLILEEQQATRLIDWHTTLIATKDELAGWEKEAENIHKEQTVFAPERKRLERAEKAAPLDELFGALLTLRKLQKEEYTRLDQEKQSLPALQAAALRLEEVCRKAVQNVLEAKQAVQNEAVVCKDVRQLDVQLAERDKQAKQLAKTCITAEKELAGLRKDCTGKREEINGAKEKLEDVKKYLREHAVDEQLNAAFEALAVQLESVQLLKNDQQSKNRELLWLRKNGTKAADLYERRKKEVTFLRRKHEQICGKTSAARESLTAHLAGRLFREYRAELGHLQQKRVFLQRIATLEQDRQRLEDGKPCPLCGAVEHPYARGNEPTADTLEEQISKLNTFLEQGHTLEEEIAVREKKEKSIAGKLAKAETELALAEKDREQAVLDIGKAEDELEAVAVRLEEVQQTTLESLVPFGIIELPDTDVESLQKSLQKRLRQWQEQMRKKETITEKIQTIVAALELEKNSMKIVEKTLAEKNSELELIRQAINRFREQRKKLYGEKDPEKEESRLGKYLAQAEQAQQKALTAQNKQQGQLVQTNTRIAALQESTKARNTLLAKQESDFLASCTKAGFTDENDFARARLTATEKQQLEQQAKDLAAKKQRAATRIRDSKAKLANLLTQEKAPLPVEDVTALRQDLQKSLKELREESGKVRQQLVANLAAQTKSKQQQEKITAQRREFARWEILHGLIGSADGKKYRNFAQGITFELMVAHANNQLVRMTDRYLLERDKSALELNVIDNYQAGEVRSTKNLSGGESFIVSLALALGLSKMAGRKIQVDSLFLDEGFGTLDEEALETSLDTLASLHQQGKLIGIISHVPALQERIATRINITPVTGGKSRVTGPGCSREA